MCTRGLSYAIRLRRLRKQAERRLAAFRQLQSRKRDILLLLLTHCPLSASTEPPDIVEFQSRRCRLFATCSSIFRQLLLQLMNTLYLPPFFPCSLPPPPPSFPFSLLPSIPPTLNTTFTLTISNIVSPSYLVTLSLSLPPSLPLSLPPSLSPLVSLCVYCALSPIPPCVPIDWSYSTHYCLREWSC